MKANFDYYKRPIVYMPLCNKINIKWYLGYYTKLLESLESFSSGNQIPSWHQKKRWEQLSIENLCKLDGSWMFVKIKEKFYMKRLLTIASNTFLLWGKLFPTSVASFWVTKTIIKAKTKPNDKPLLSNYVGGIRPWFEIVTRHCGPLVALQIKNTLVSQPVNN